MQSALRGTATRRHVRCHLEVDPGVSLVDPSVVKVFHLLHRPERKLIAMLREGTAVQALIEDGFLRKKRTEKPNFYQSIVHCWPPIAAQRG